MKEPDESMDIIERDWKQVNTGETVTLLKVLKRATRLELATLSLGS